MFSIIIPVHNAESFLIQCLKSVHEQSLDNWECLIIDDGSSDDSAAICADWCKIDSRFKYFHQSNKGVSAARNVGLCECNGDYICFIDADDWVDRCYLESLESSIKESDLVVSGQKREYQDGNYVLFAPDKTTTFSVSSDNTSLFLSLERQFLLFAPHEKLYRADIINNHNLRFREDCSYGEDLLFNYQYLEHIKVISTIDLSLYHYRIHSDTLSLSFRENQFKEDYAQWLILMDFHKKRKLWDGEAEAFLAKRLWGIVYDGLFLYPKLGDKRGYLSRVLSIPEISLLRKRDDVFSCSQWIKYSITHRLSAVFYLFFNMNRKDTLYSK